MLRVGSRMQDCCELYFRENVAIMVVGLNLLGDVWHVLITTIKKFQLLLNFWKEGFIRKANYHSQKSDKKQIELATNKFNV